MATTKKLVVDPKVLALLRNEQFKPEAPVYEQNEVLVTIPANDYEIRSKLVPQSGNSKPWTAYECVFQVGKEEFSIRMRSGQVPDEDADMAICSFTANRDFTTTSGKVIKKGDEKVFAVNA